MRFDGMQRGALGQIGDVSAVSALVTILQDQSNSSEVCAALAHALGIIGDNRAIVPLISSFQSQDTRAASAAVWALGRISDIRAVGPLIKVAQEDVLYTEFAGVVESLERILKRNIADVEVEILYGAANLKNATLQVKPPVCNLAGEYLEIDYSPIRQLARQELIRRREQA